MRTKFIFSLLILLAGAISISAQITREQADVIALDYLQSESDRPFKLYVNVNTPNEDGFVITTYNEETVRAKYACWVYFVHEAVPFHHHPYSTPFRYLFVKEDNGSLLEVITSNDVLLSDLESAWEVVEQSGLVEVESRAKQLYPNPASDWLNLSCNGENLQVTIYDLNGSRLFSEMLSGENACQINVSFLKTGVYVVNVNGEAYRIIKK